MQKALEEDSTVYDYDAVYDEIQNQRLENSKKVLQGTDKRVILPTFIMCVADFVNCEVSDSFIVFWDCCRVCVGSDIPVVEKIQRCELELSEECLLYLCLCHFVTAEVYPPVNESHRRPKEGTRTKGREEDPEGKGGRGRAVCR